MTFLLVFLFGGVGAIARYLLQCLIPPARGVDWATLMTNAVGSFIAGLVTGGLAGLLPPEWATGLVTGFLGGFTTFGTASLNARELMDAGRPWCGLAVAFATLALSVFMALLGLFLTR